MPDSTDTRPNANTYWVVSHKFLAGEYPGDKDPVKAREKINQLLEVGVRHFVDLTEFGEYDFVPYEAILSEGSRAANITTTYQRFPIRDISVPSDAEHLAEILFAIDRRIRQGGIVYVHCRGGVGRTGLVVACWLQEHGRRPDSALGELSAKWRTVQKSSGQHASPETPEQVDWVKTWPQRRRNVQKLMLCDRCRGALLGLAVGDALGTHYGNLPTVPDPRWQRAAVYSSSGRTICEAPRPVCGGSGVNSLQGDRPVPQSLLRPTCSPPNP